MAVRERQRSVRLSCCGQVLWTQRCSTAWVPGLRELPTLAAPGRKPPLTKPRGAWVQRGDPGALQRKGQTGRRELRNMGTAEADSAAGPRREPGDDSPNLAKTRNGVPGQCPPPSRGLEPRRGWAGDDAQDNRGSGVAFRCLLGHPRLGLTSGAEDPEGREAAQAANYPGGHHLGLKRTKVESAYSRGGGAEDFSSLGRDAQAPEGLPD